jgi:hypothetical protein
MQDLISKITLSKKFINAKINVEGMVNSKQVALSSNPNTSKNLQKQEGY